jgi:integrase
MPAITLVQFESEIIVMHEGKDHAPSTIRQSRQVLREFREIGAMRTSDMTDVFISAWKKAHPKRTPVTLRSHLRCLGAMCTRARKKGYLKVDPFDIDPVNEWVRDDAPTARPKKQWSLNVEETRRVLELVDMEAKGGDWDAMRMQSYVWGLLMLGMRPGELQRLEVWDLDMNRRTVTIRAKEVPVQGKGMRWWRPKTVGSAATLPIGDELFARWAKWAPKTGCTWLFPGKKRRGPWTSGGPGVNPLDQVKALGERAGVKLWNKSGRKGVGTNGKCLTSLERKGLFRHADESTGDFYDEESVEALRPAANRMERLYLTGS